MKNYTRILTLLLVFLMLIQATAFGPFEYDMVYAASGTGYTSADDVVYKTSGKYIYNWGVREEDATFLTKYALSFYTGSNTYDMLSELDGGTTDRDAPNSALYKALSSLMSSKHSYVTSYDATRSLFQYTDCENGGGKISSFYSGDPVGPSWDSGKTWNREHCWPNSKGDASGNGENDIMMLRPASVSENSSRGNKAYGQSSGYYNPNSESSGSHDLRGDVARIVLYTYVRWKCTNTGSSYNPNGITGTNGVIESIDVLLTWIEADPVDTWELGRNDAVQAITGTRNVFVDYPEFAFLLFGEEIPEMTTPSGEAKDGACHWDNGKITKEPTCTSTGIKTYTCTDSGCSKTKTETVSALGHSWDGGKTTTYATCTTTGVTTITCTRCSTTKTTTIAVLGHSWGAWVTITEPTCTTTGTKTQTCNRDHTHVNTQTIPVLGHSFGDWVITVEPTCKSVGYKTRTCANDPAHIETIAIPTSDHAWGGWITDTEPTEASDGTKHRVCSDCGERENGVIPSPGHQHKYTSTVINPTCSSQGYTTHTCACGDSYNDSYVNKLNHSYNSVVTAPTCSSSGYTTHTCSACGDSYTDAHVAQLTHSYSDGKCVHCGNYDPSYDINAKDNFVDAVDELKNLQGEVLYDGICYALEIYEKLNSSDKASVAEKFIELKNIAKNYNTDATNVNSYSYFLSKKLVGITVTISTISLALYCLFGKKYV